MLSLSEHLVDGARWRSSRVFTDVVVTDLSLDEARLLASHPGARRAVEAAFDALRARHGALRGLLLLIRDGERTAIGFTELLRTDAQGFVWSGPFSPMGDLL